MEHRHQYTPERYDGVAIHDRCECGREKVVGGSRTSYKNQGKEISQVATSERDLNRYNMVVRSNPVIS